MWKYLLELLKNLNISLTAEGKNLDLSARVKDPNTKTDANISIQTKKDSTPKISLEINNKD